MELLLDVLVPRLLSYFFDWFLLLVRNRLHWAIVVLLSMKVLVNLFDRLVLGDGNYDLLEIPRCNCR